MTHFTYHKESFLNSRRFGWLLMVVCLLGSGLCFWQALMGGLPTRSSEVFRPVPQSAPTRRPELLTRKIQDIRPGMRVLAENPELAGQIVEPLVIQPEDWRLVTLELPKADGQILTVELLRPHEELKWTSVPTAQGSPLASELLQYAFLFEPTLETPVKLCRAMFAVQAILIEAPAGLNGWQRGEPLIALPQSDQTWLGWQLYLDQAEVGAVGWATITKVRPCPPIEKGEGRIVTGRYVHKAANVIDLRVTGISEPIGTTDTHPFWSEDRQAFVPAGELRAGEKLRSLAGSQTVVLAKTARGPPEDVFNIEVEGQHTYYVAETGVLVHNMCAQAADNNGGLWSRFKGWINKGSENDEYYKSLSRADKLNYMRGQKTFSKGFYDKHREVLDSFTAGKAGNELVDGIIARGKWLKANHPIRSSSLNIIDFFRGIGTTISSGPDPASRKILKWLFRIKE